MIEKRFKSRCYEKQKNVVIYDDGEKLFDVSYRDFEDAYYLKMKLSPVIDKLNELDTELKSSPRVDVNEIESLVCENQQLKLWQDNVFKLIKAKIKVYQHKPVSAPVSNPFSNTYDAEHDRLSRLSELESLLQEVLLL